jgi:hypothetical protein
VSRYKGRQNAKAVEQDFPHYVDVVVPEGGFGMKLNAMYDFYARHGIQPKRGCGRHDANGSVIRRCFADPAIADAFSNEFGVASQHERGNSNANKGQC